MIKSKLTEQEEIVLFKLEDGRQLNFYDSKVLLSILDNKKVDINKLPQNALIQAIEFKSFLILEKNGFFDTEQYELEKAIQEERYEDAVYYRNLIDSFI